MSAPDKGGRRWISVEDFTRIISLDANSLTSDMIKAKTQSIEETMKLVKANKTYFDKYGYYRRFNTKETDMSILVNYIAEDIKPLKHDMIRIMMDNIEKVLVKYKNEIQKSISSPITNTKRKYADWNEIILSNFIRKIQ
jgi:hypothetical protein